jgi:biopolymer transport protein ExbB/TolQ
MNINSERTPRQPRGLFAQVLTVIGGVLVLGAAFMVSLVFFAVVAVAALILWLYFWWKTRALRQHLREQMARQPAEPPASSPAASAGDVIEGEAVRVADERNRLDE